MDRKKFISQTALGCIGLTGILGIASCSTISNLTVDVKNNIIDVPLSAFLDKSVLKLRSSNLQYDILLIKKSDGTFLSLYMKCTHNDSAVQFDGKNFQCPLHGSTFNGEGIVTNGPANKPLLRLNNIVSNDIVKIYTI